ncbi:aminopeptidase P family protein [Halovulum sp. GXIMD14793]
MFQSFSQKSSPVHGATRVAELRRKLADMGLNAFVVPRSDAHQGEYVPERDERLAWLTGFTGSAGFAAVTSDKAAMFVDGRYTLQVRTQTDSAVFDALSLPQQTPAKWLAETLDAGVVGFDPWLHTKKQVEEMEKALHPAGLTLKPVENPIDAIWTDQPAPPAEPVRVHPDTLAGRSHQDKRQELAADLSKAGPRAAILSLPDGIAWLLNIRGADVPRAPLPLCFAILHEDASVDLFIDAAKLNDDIRAHLGAEVRINQPDALEGAIAQLQGPVALDETASPYRFLQILETAGAEVIWRRDPCILPKACKIAAELNGVRAAHLRDAGAMVEFLAWLDQEAPGGTLTEIQVVEQLEAFRRASNQLQDISFDTISGAGPDGAIVHYRVTDETNRTVTPSDLMLVDSGGQYLDGTTDITRTVATGTPPEGAVRAFTLVLKGMIAISRARWPEGLAGRDLDALARIALWQEGFDYDHGTGHGVGAYLSVHEGPQNLSRRGEEPLRAGMILSNEPGYYREGAFGIRIENLVIVTPPATPEGGDRPMLGFETLTLAPIDQRLIDKSLLVQAEIDWLNAYHDRVRRKVAPLVSDSAATWLADATRAL